MNKLDNKGRPRIVENNTVFTESVYIWEQINGPVPEGSVIHHIDHNPKNNNIDNLQLMTREKHLSHHHTLKIDWQKIYQEYIDKKYTNYDQIAAINNCAWITVVRNFRKIRGG